MTNRAAQLASQANAEGHAYVRRHGFLPGQSTTVAQAHMAYCAAVADGRQFSDVGHERAMRRHGEAFAAMHGRRFGEQSERDRAAIAKAERPHRRNR